MCEHGLSALETTKSLECYEVKKFEMDRFPCQSEYPTNFSRRLWMDRWRQLLGTIKTIIMEEQGRKTPTTYAQQWDSFMDWLDRNIDKYLGKVGGLLQCR